MIGTHVVTPRGGMAAVIAEDNDLRRLATEDGRTVIRSAWCSDPNGVAQCRGQQPIYYEVIEGVDRGQHGWSCSICRRLLQTG